MPASSGQLGLIRRLTRALSCEDETGKLLDQARAELVLLRELETWARRGGFEGPTVTPLLTKLDALRAKAGT